MGRVVFSLLKLLNVSLSVPLKQESEEPAFWAWGPLGPAGPEAGSRLLLALFPSTASPSLRTLPGGSGQETLAKLLAEAALQEGLMGVSATLLPHGAPSPARERSEESVLGEKKSGAAPGGVWGRSPTVRKDDNTRLEKGVL